MPGKICQSCKSQLLNFYTFKQKCKRTEQVLQLTIAPDTNASHEKAKLFHDIELETMDIIDSEQQSSQQTEPNILIEVSGLNQCQLCDRVFHEENDLKQHMPCHFEEEEESLKECQHEGTTDREAAIVERELSTIVEDRSLTPIDYWVSEELEELESSDNGHLDGECNDQLAEIEMHVINSNFKQHVRDESSVISGALGMTCNICGKTITGQKHFLRHMRSHEANSSITDYFTFHNCNVCRKVYLAKDQLTDHIRNECRQEKTAKQACEDIAFKCSTCSLESRNEQHIKQVPSSYILIKTC